MLNVKHKNNKQELQQERFNEIHARDIAAAQKLVENFSSSDEDEGELDQEQILTSMYKQYNSLVTDTVKTSSFLENVLHSGAATCLICIATVRRVDPIWTCKHCFSFFHLNCIRRWANDSISHLKEQSNQQQSNQGYYNHLGEYVPPKKMRSLCWCCPKCRSEYNPNDRPVNYECFCGKEVNPQPQPWLVPHSCGEICGKSLQPLCGHNCLLLCHPGPCPPCAQYAVLSCQCGKSQTKSVRCTERNWQCAQKCSSKLSCGEHICNKLCHIPGNCPPCSSTSMQACECGNETKLRSCFDLKWHCKKVCRLKYACGIHTCKKLCHSGPCGECPLGLPRSCPCGKTTKIGPCSEVIEPCGDTCQKVLSCLKHTCAQRCHRGVCNLCLIITRKKCRCGMHEKEVPCSKEFTCETKCKQIRDCGKHPCNRKCCNGSCLPCDKFCGKSLSCKKHKCQSICHEGPCYPCKQTSQIKCSCGKSNKIVPCGRERTARIICLEYCRVPSKCHHSSKHRCHKKECPPCHQKCGLVNDTCSSGHTCESICHDAVKVLRKTNLNQTNIWDRSKMIQFKKYPHPQCEQIVTVKCIGGHEVAEWPCWNSKPTSCQRKCNRLLKCGNHKCELVCHSVPNIDDMKEQIGCASCEHGCNIPRSNGCIHPCLRACHLPPCYSCNVNIKSKCHCGLNVVNYKCFDFFNTEIDDAKETILERQERLKSCGGQCIKNYPCGHRCHALCHTGKCPNPELCRKKVRIYCDCKNLKVDVSCEKHRAGLSHIQCNENCFETRAKYNHNQQQEADQLKLQEEAINRLELEIFEKKFNKRKRKDRKVILTKTEKKINWKIISISAGIITTTLLAIAVAFYAE